VIRLVKVTFHKILVESEISPLHQIISHPFASRFKECDIVFFLPLTKELSVSYFLTIHFVLMVGALVSL